MYVKLLSATNKYVKRVNYRCLISNFMDTMVRLQRIPLINPDIYLQVHLTEFLQNVCTYIACVPRFFLKVAESIEKCSLRVHCMQMERHSCDRGPCAWCLCKYAQSQHGALSTEHRSLDCSCVTSKQRNEKGAALLFYYDHYGLVRHITNDLL